MCSKRLRWPVAISAIASPKAPSPSPTARSTRSMLSWAYDALGERDDDLLELYCGNGNFTLPLATRVRKVLATEISKSSVNAALANLADNGVDNVDTGAFVRRRADRSTQRGAPVPPPGSVSTCPATTSAPYSSTRRAPAWIRTPAS